MIEYREYKGTLDGLGINNFQRYHEITNNNNKKRRGGGRTGNREMNKRC